MVRVQGEEPRARRSRPGATSERLAAIDADTGLVHDANAALIENFIINWSIPTSVIIITSTRAYVNRRVQRKRPVEK